MTTEDEMGAFHREATPRVYAAFAQLGRAEAGLAIAKLVQKAAPRAAGGVARDVVRASEEMVRASRRICDVEIEGFARAAEDRAELLGRGQ